MPRHSHTHTPRQKLTVSRSSREAQAALSNLHAIPHRHHAARVCRCILTLQKHSAPRLLMMVVVGLWSVGKSLLSFCWEEAQNPKVAMEVVAAAAAAAAAAAVDVQVWW